MMSIVDVEAQNKEEKTILYGIVPEADEEYQNKTERIFCGGLDEQKTT